MKSKILLSFFIILSLFALNSCNNNDYENSTHLKTESELLPKEMVGWYRGVLVDNAENGKDDVLKTSLIYVNINYNKSMVHLAARDYLYQGRGFIANKQNEDDHYERIVVDVKDKVGISKYFAIKYRCEDTINCDVILQAFDNWQETKLEKLNNAVTEEIFISDYNSIISETN